MAEQLTSPQRSKAEILLQNHRKAFNAKVFHVEDNDFTDMITKAKSSKIETLESYCMKLEVILKEYDTRKSALKVLPLRLNCWKLNSVVKAKWLH